LVALAAVAGPGLLAGLSDDDPAGITTYSILGADYGYQLLWVLMLSTAALILFHELGARMGRDDARTVGSRVHPVLRRRQAAPSARSRL
jgi:Mn2+/Fe2+ NRAMP family transporter